jgi:hypothetical protein
MEKENFSLSDIKDLGYDSGIFNIANSADKNAVNITSNHITNNLYGINHRQTPTPVPMNKDSYGLTFFTRPQLNFQGANLKQSRLFHPLLTTEANSWQRYIRCTLDPRLAGGYISEDGPLEAGAGGKGYTTDLVDPEMAFIPLLSNNLNTITGWKDILVPSYTSKSGQFREEFTMVDGVTVDYTVYSLTANFRNMRGDPITRMFFYWAHYMSLVTDGTLVPYPDFIVANELDYCSRIYRLVLDANKHKVQAIAACGACWPEAVPIASTFDYSRDKPYNDSTSEISIPLRAMGYICQDDILIRTFNDTVGIFQPAMRNGDGTDPYAKPGGAVTKIERALLPIFNNRGYPRIDPDTYELEWYVKTSEFAAKMAAFSNFDAILESATNLSVKPDSK